MNVLEHLNKRFKAIAWVYHRNCTDAAEIVMKEEAEAETEIFLTKMGGTFLPRVVSLVPCRRCFRFHEVSCVSRLTGPISLDRVWIQLLILRSCRYLDGKALRLAGCRSSKGSDDDVRCRASEGSVFDGNEGIEQRMQWSVLEKGYALSGKLFDEGFWYCIGNLKRG